MDAFEKLELFEDVNTVRIICSGSLKKRPSSIEADWIAEMDWDLISDDEPRARRYAALFADAPNLLAQRDAAIEALKAGIDALETHDIDRLPDSFPSKKALIQMRAAIAAAEGGE